MSHQHTPSVVVRTLHGIEQAKRAKEGEPPRCVECQPSDAIGIHIADLFRCYVCGQFYCATHAAIHFDLPGRIVREDSPEADEHIRAARVKLKIEARAKRGRHMPRPGGGHCGAESPDGWRCILLDGHEGDHLSLDYQAMWEGSPGAPIHWSTSKTETVAAPKTIIVQDMGDPAQTVSMPLGAACPHCGTITSDPCSQCGQAIR